MRQVFFYKPAPAPPRNEEDWRWWFNVWTPAAIAVAIICVESTETFSSQNTSSWLRPIFQHLLGAISDSTWDFFHHLLRKSGHFVGYGVLSFLLFRAWRATLPLASGALWSMQWARIAFFMTALVASLDEWHQTFLPSRTGRWQDVVLDSSAALTVQAVMWIVLRGRRRLP